MSRIEEEGFVSSSMAVHQISPHLTSHPTQPMHLIGFRSHVSTHQTTQPNTSHFAHMIFAIIHSCQQSVFEGHTPPRDAVVGGTVLRGTVRGGEWSGSATSDHNEV